MFSVSTGNCSGATSLTWMQHDPVGRIVEHFFSMQVGLVVLPVRYRRLPSVPACGASAGLEGQWRECKGGVSALFRLLS